MKLRFYELDIRVSELQTTRVSVASWEHPILQAVWGDSVIFVNEVVIDRDPPDPADEFRRLANRYGSAEVEGAPFVSSVYGQFGPGVTSLAKAIKEGTFEGATVSVERPAQSVPAAGQVPAGIAQRVNQLEKELEEARALQTDLAVAQDDGKNNVPLSKSEIETVKAAAPDKLVEQIEEAEKTPTVVTQAMLDASKGAILSDDEIVELIGDIPAPSAA